MTVGTTIGSVIPLVINRLGIDPAVASGPFITTINDIVSMLIYFGLATTFMSYLTWGVPMEFVSLVVVIVAAMITPILIHRLKISFYLLWSPKF